MFKYNVIREFCEKVFLKIGCSMQDAKLASEVLISADLQGIDSHGISRLKGYVRLWKKNRLNVNPNIRVVHERLSTAVIDGDEGLGLVVAPAAMKKAIEKAIKAGTGWVAVKNSNHFGIASYHAMMAVKHNMIGITMTNASPLVAPTFSKERMLGTNPIAVAVPASKQAPFVADFSTSTITNGKLEMLQRKNMDLPYGWVQTDNGENSVDAFEVQKGGALLPLGSDFDHSSHKGYCLGSIVDIFSGVLSGANFGPWVPPFVSFIESGKNLVGKGIGHFLGAICIDAFMSTENFKNQMDKWIECFKNAKSIDKQQKVLIPGDSERKIMKERRSNGIPLLPSVIEDLNLLAQQLNIPSLKDDN